jgi:ubiquitin C-terminal hydrolase
MLAALVTHICRFVELDDRRSSHYCLVLHTLTRKCKQRYCCYHCDTTSTTAAAAALTIVATTAATAACTSLLTLLATAAVEH